MAALFGALTRAGVRNADRHEYATGVLGRDVTTFSDLSTADVNRLMTAIAAANTHEEVA
ncbi:hypothetical protein [Kineosporia succinea]|uniref:Uncharacterized protein n=1 Tax=Kineosporia succinea TaxID=84632 RepID=A0ABT9P9G2_9ACTN|nr:hypothetical protein [Kineosporia succinea]MDP9829339.1 hypothetical protein [Kineosporia succinea]